MATPISPEAGALRALIHEFIRSRLQDKLDKLKADEQDKRTQLLEDHQPVNWLACAAKRVGQIQLATHTLKPIHPDARGSNLHVPTSEAELPGLVSSSILSEPDDDVVGNAAALDVYKLLKLECAGQTLLQRALAADPTLTTALSDDQEQAEEWRAAFAGIVDSKGGPASHPLARQLYFPLEDGSYHLLAPLFPTSLVHRLQRTLRNDRFGEAAKAAREARSKGESWPAGYCEYPDMAIRNFGGTKPQNISQLNSERYGENWLLAALPPQWQSDSVRPPLGVPSVFERAFGRQRRVLELSRALRDFLHDTAHNNVHIRRRRAALVAAICDELMQYAARLSELEPGWSADPDCELHPAERRWLDPRHAHDYRGDWQREVSQRFANWLNAVIASDRLRLGEDEHAQWRTDLHGELNLIREVLDDQL